MTESTGTDAPPFDIAFALALVPQSSEPYVADGQIKFTYAGELDLRGKLAKVAEAYGWLVDQEVVVPGWGRIDLVLRETADATPYLIELKLDLTKPAKIRRAFQQADGYGRWWAMHRGETNHTYVVGVDSDLGAIRPVQQAYPEVGYCTAPDLMRNFAFWGDPGKREWLAFTRARDLRSLLNVHTAALRELADLRTAANPAEVSS